MAQKRFPFSLDWRNSMLLRIAAMVLLYSLCAVIALPQSVSNQVTNADIAKMLKAGVDPKVVKWVIENSDGKALDASLGALQALKGAGDPRQS